MKRQSASARQDNPDRPQRLRIGRARWRPTRLGARFFLSKDCLARLLVSLVGTLALAVFACNAWIMQATRDRIYDAPFHMPVFDVALVLGTSPYTHNGKPNVLFENRISAAARLYHTGQVRHLLLSGANPSRAYNEPRKMYQALRRHGVPGEAMTLDFAGFRTLDSIVRARRVFDLTRAIIVTQRYHEYRALFLAQHTGLAAIGYTWPDGSRREPLRTEAREYLARIKALLDLYVLHTQPRFLGPQRPIDLSPRGTRFYAGCDRRRAQPQAGVGSVGNRPASRASILAPACRSAV